MLAGFSPAFLQAAALISPAPATPGDIVPLQYIKKRNVLPLGWLGEQ